MTPHLDDRMGLTMERGATLPFGRAKRASWRAIAIVFSVHFGHSVRIAQRIAWRQGK
jgi:hypothetical protein